MRVSLVMISGLLVALVSQLGQRALACPVGNVGTSISEIKKMRDELKARGPKRGVASAHVLPSSDSTQPWGGPDAEKWRPEAVFANAASRALNAAFARSGVLDATVSMPVVMEYFGSSERVYGDGQTNAAIGFGAWTAKTPPLIATLLQLAGNKRKLVMSFAPEAMKASRSVTITYRIAGQESTRIAALGADGRAEWDVPPSLEFGTVMQNQRIWIQAADAPGKYPIDFRIPIVTGVSLQAEAREARTLGLKAYDPIDIAGRSRAAAVVPMDTLLGGSYGGEWVHSGKGEIPLKIESVHGGVCRGGRYIDGVCRDGQFQLNAVGGGNTWLVDKGGNSTFKNLYTCFNARNYDAEKDAHVPSGGGWHEIGDAAETVINNMEQASVLVGFAAGLEKSSDAAFGLSDVASARLLRPGEALVTGAGSQTWSEEKHRTADKDPRGSGPGADRNYHWFAFDSSDPVCTQEWVHNCRPGDVAGDRYGLRCK